MINLEEVKNRTLSLERTFNAPIDLVWKAWTETSHIANWWGPKGMEFTVEEHSFEVGGSWRFSMPMPNGASFVSEGVYSEIIEKEKIVTSADFKPMTEGVTLIALFEALGEKTKFTFHVVHETEEYCKQQEQMGFYNGWASAFDRLALVVEA